MIFTDVYERTIDDKNRTQIPAPYRNGMDPEIDGTAFYVVPGERNHTLSFYPERYFERRIESIRTDDIPGSEALDFEQMFFSLASRVELDKQGRVVLPERLLAMVDLGKEICIAGADYRFDIWRKSAYENFIRDAVDRRSALQGFLRGRKGSVAANE